ncbi:MAG: hypothetical protein HRT51_17560 [Colwellia sp.]|nr:hypothetical protein [Colwellia sp.]
MELKDFVKEALVQIASGVEESIAAVRESGGYVNPAVKIDISKSDGSHFSSLGNGQNVFLIDFDVAVTVEEETGTNAEEKLKVASLLSLGAGGKSANKASATNRIHFKVPLGLPVDPVTSEELKNREQERTRKTREAIQRIGNLNKNRA